MCTWLFLQVYYSFFLFIHTMQSFKQYCKMGRKSTHHTCNVFTRFKSITNISLMVINVWLFKSKPTMVRWWRRSFSQDARIWDAPDQKLDNYISCTIVSICEVSNIIWWAHGAVLMQIDCCTISVYYPTLYWLLKVQSVHQPPVWDVSAIAACQFPQGWKILAWKGTEL